MFRGEPLPRSTPCAEASASSERLAWRALRATSVMPFLWPSSSSSTIMGKNTSCSSNRNRLMGSCMSTLVSSTNNLVGPLARLLRVGLAFSRALSRGAGAAACGAAATCAVSRTGAALTGLAGRLALVVCCCGAGLSMASDAALSWSSSGLSKALWVRRLARWVGAGGSGMDESLLKKVKRMPLKKKKPPGGQGGFSVVCGADFHRHEFIMHEPCDNSGS